MTLGKPKTHSQLKLKPVLPVAFNIVTICAAVVIIGCSFHRPSVGEGGALTIIADSLDRPIIQNVLDKTFGQIIETPQPEQVFRYVWTDAKQLTQHTRNPLMLMATTVNGTGSTAILLKRMLSQEVMDGVQNGDYMVFKRDDPWARNQLLMIIVGRDQRELAERLASWDDSLYHWATEFELNRMTKQLFSKGEQIELEEELTAKYGFSLRIQHDFSIAESNDSLNYVRLIRYLPERWLMVAWGDMAHADSLTPEFVYAHRKRLGANFLDPIEHYDDRLTWEQDTLAGRNCLKIRGLWATVAPIGGGPFVSFALYVPEEQRYYIVDGAVFAPDKTKIQYLWQIETLARTFKPISDSKKENT